LCSNHFHCEGQLEETIANSFTRSANLRALLLKAECPPAIKNCSSIFAKLVHPDVRSATLFDISEFTITDDEELPDEVLGGLTPLKEPVYRALCTFFGNSPPRAAKSLSYFTINTRTFSIMSRHKGNSSVLIRQAADSKAESLPGHIEEIIQTSPIDVLFAVRFYKKRVARDPFPQYPVLRSSMWHLDLGQLVIVRPKDIECHFASLVVNWDGLECVAVVSLARVCASFV